MLLYKLIRLITYPILAIIFPTKLLNRSNFFEEKAVLCCNHFSSLDAIIIASKLLKNGCHCIGKEEAFKSKIANYFFLKMGAIPIKRGENDLVAYRKILATLNAGKQLLIFPEGTRNKSGTSEMNPFFTGAALFAIKSKSPIIPILLFSKPKPFRRNYIYIGESFNLDEFASLPPHEMKEQATKKLFENMQASQKSLNGIVLGETLNDH